MSMQGGGQGNGRQELILFSPFHLLSELPLPAPNRIWGYCGSLMQSTQVNLSRHRTRWGAEKGSGRADKDIKYPVLCTLTAEIPHYGDTLVLSLPDASKCWDKRVQGFTGNTGSLHSVQPQRRQVDKNTDNGDPGITDTSVLALFSGTYQTWILLTCHAFPAEKEIMNTLICPLHMDHFPWLPI